LAGVEAVMTAKDVPHNETVTRFGQTHKVGGFEGLYRVLAEKKIRFRGEAIALVAAKSLVIAERALGLIKVEYEPLEGVFDPVEAMKPGAYRVGEDESNVICSYKVQKVSIWRMLSLKTPTGFPWWIMLIWNRNPVSPGWMMTALLRFGLRLRLLSTSAALPMFWVCPTIR
jgi:hypothetical protein